TGHSGLSRLRRFPIDEIKIDRSFVAGVGLDRDDEAIVRAVIGLGQAMGHRVVAEGIETEMQLERLRQEGCEVGQGYLLGRP
ncbi:EAL domain-containing protein, partial [Vibrio parahaemolyticus]